MTNFKKYHLLHNKNNTLKITLIHIAKETGYHKNQISNYFTGKTKKIPYPVMVFLADTYKIHISKLLD